jgi:hypothetical protein
VVTTDEAMKTESQRYITVSSGMEETPFQNTPVQRLQRAILPLDLTCSGFVTHSGEIQTTGRSRNKYGNKNKINLFHFCTAVLTANEVHKKKIKFHGTHFLNSEGHHQCPVLYDVYNICPVPYKKSAMTDVI